MATHLSHELSCGRRHGHSIVGDRRLDWVGEDVFTVPTWTFCEHINSGDRPTFLLSFSDAQVMQALSLYRHKVRS